MSSIGEHIGVYVACPRSLEVSGRMPVDDAQRVEPVGGFNG